MDIPFPVINEDKYLILFTQFLILSFMASYSNDQGRKSDSVGYRILQVLVFLLILFGK